MSQEQAVENTDVQIDSNAEYVSFIPTNGNDLAEFLKNNVSREHTVSTFQEAMLRNILTCENARTCEKQNCWNKWRQELLFQPAEAMQLVKVRAEESSGISSSICDTNGVSATRDRLRFTQSLCTSGADAVTNIIGINCTAKLLVNDHIIDNARFTVALPVLAMYTQISVAMEFDPTKIPATFGYSADFIIGCPKTREYWRNRSWTQPVVVGQLVYWEGLVAKT